MYTCKNSVYANSINKKTTTPSSSLYLSHRKKIFKPHNLLCQIPKQQGVALKHNSYDRRLTRIKALHLFPDHCAPYIPSTYTYEVFTPDTEHFVINGFNDPILTIKLGDTLQLKLQPPLKTEIFIKYALSGGSGNQVPNVTNQGGLYDTLSFTPTSKGKYYYQSGSWSHMNGIIQVNPNPQLRNN